MKTHKRKSPGHIGRWSAVRLVDVSEMNTWGWRWKLMPDGQQFLLGPHGEIVEHQVDTVTREIRLRWIVKRPRGFWRRKAAR